MRRQVIQQVEKIHTMPLKATSLKLVFVTDRADATMLLDSLSKAGLGSAVELRLANTAAELEEAFGLAIWDLALVDWPLGGPELLAALKRSARQAPELALLALVDAPDEGALQSAREAGLSDALAWSELPGRLHEAAQRAVIRGARRKSGTGELRQSRNELAVLHGVAAAAFEARSESELIERVSSLIAETLNPGRFGILTLDPSTQTLSFHPSCRGITGKEKTTPFALGEGTIGAVALTGRPVNMPEVERREPSLHRGSETCSQLCVPIRLRDEILGVINVERDHPHAFSAEDQRLMMTLGIQLGVAIDHMRSEESARRRLAQLAAIHDASQEIAAARLDMQAVCEAIHSATARLLQFDVFTITLWDEKNHEIEGIYLFDGGRTYPSFRIRDDQGWSGYVLRTGVSMRIDDFLKERDRMPSSVHFGKPVNARSVLVVPLKLSGKVIGTFSVQSYKPCAFNSDDLAMLELMAGHAAIALQNARLYEEVSRQALTFANIFDAIILTDGRRIIDWNPAAERMFQYRRDEVIGKPVTIIRPPDSAEELEDELIEKLLRDGRWEGEYTFMRRDGSTGTADLVVLPIFDSQGKLTATLGVNRDITRRKLAEEALRISQERLAAIIDSAMDGIITMDERGKIFLFNEAAERMFGCGAEEMIGQAVGRLMPELLFEDLEQGAKAVTRGRDADRMVSGAIYTRASRVNGEEFPAEVTISKVAVGESVFLTTIIRDVSAQVRAQMEMSRLAGVVQQAAEAVVITDLAGDILYVNPYFERVTGYTFEEVRGKNPRILKSGYQDERFYRRMWQRLTSGKPWTGRLVNRRKDGSLFYENSTIFPVKDASGRIINYAAVKRNITDEVQREREMQAIVSVSTALRKAETRAEMLPIILDQLLELLRGNGAAIASYDPSRKALYLELGRGTAAVSTGRYFQLGEGISGLVFAAEGPYLTSDLQAEPQFKLALPLQGITSVVGAPLMVQGEKIGVLWVGRSYPFTPEEFRVLQAVADMSANAIHRASLHERTLRYAEQTVAITAAGRAMAETLDLGDIYRRLSASVNDLVGGVSTLAIVKVDAPGGWGRFIYAVSGGREWDVTGAEGLTLSDSGCDLFLRAIQSHEPQLVDSVRCIQPQLSPLSLELPEDGSAVIVPLVTRGKALGVMVLVSPTRGRFTAEETGLLMLIGSTTATAIENADLYQGLQESNRELLDAYDRTIEGWSRALDLRDRETEFHTQRVTELTLRLAEEIGLAGERLVHIRRGAMLHDIGKMGVPDRILLKQDALTEEEWKVMRMHPAYAYEMLAPIAYLRPALNIPYCHHEKWDGSGYPRGLAGEEIPLEARIFALADVFDALTNVRPYRPAWPRSQAIQYIREQAGRHFDPHLAEVFLRLIDPPA